ncbi:MAG: glycine cleavage T C-terminal barrel domain-containing protein, partial [Candidatus Omnitrophota bacterium]|nr:glycine cleavage T C-terminal barrel domain-containing protein [Candidatus Omnitrophota bacterium]
APRHGYSIIREGKEIGRVTSGSFSPSLCCGIGLGYVMAPYAKMDEKLLITNGHIEIEAVITNRPFYKDSTLRN